ncbi:MAG: hypothetical protein AAGD32_05260 [Planctomycetota bacterium]
MSDSTKKSAWELLKYATGILVLLIGQFVATDKAIDSVESRQDRAEVSAEYTIKQIAELKSELAEASKDRWTSKDQEAFSKAIYKEIGQVAATLLQVLEEQKARMPWFTALRTDVLMLQRDVGDLKQHQRQEDK